ncbi:toxin-antitoxin system YwqK family antitoxin [Engelhardtia mirabilis]|uniref:MORN repeat protein n=1 Tax=Engelhardtia mirabilis TaxID=2528011 RepID=A0A518BN31_9BACT|nr:hypothetical protein Pla133_34800 [Planctomycetes bacterium Pla133]QDV02709.1 hypothetical protein Pla86_34780 [Planctomycetes bacterium Pla86]
MGWKRLASVCIAACICVIFVFWPRAAQPHRAADSPTDSVAALGPSTSGEQAFSAHGPSERQLLPRDEGQREIVQHGGNARAEPGPVVAPSTVANKVGGEDVARGPIRAPIFDEGQAVIFGPTGLVLVEGPYTGPPVPDARDYDDLDKQHINGTWYEYSDSGVLLVVTDYRRGVANGYGEAFYEDGSRRGQGWQVNGIFHGQCTFWHEDGTLDTDRTGLYQYGEKVSE